MTTQKSLFIILKGSSSTTDTNFTVAQIIVRHKESFGNGVNLCSAQVIHLHVMIMIYEFALKLYSKMCTREI